MINDKSYAPMDHLNKLLVKQLDSRGRILQEEESEDTDTDSAKTNPNFYFWTEMLEDFNISKYNETALKPLDYGVNIYVIMNNARIREDDQAIESFLIDIQESDKELDTKI